MEQRVGDRTVSKRAKRLSPEASRSLALEAAQQLLIETGPQSVTLKAVAGRIGRTHANLLHHFGSASGLQRDLAEYLAKDICRTIGEAVTRLQGGEMAPRQLADLIFDSFDEGGAGALASWMLLSGNEDALDPIVDTIHKLVDDIAVDGHADHHLHEITLEMVLLALGDALMGGPLTGSLGLPRESGRMIAERRIAQSLADSEDKG
ncbi:MAG: TetR/AcrR family transcriptional regulator [Sphingomonadales bacterium]|nr:TetR/AcrR family transcriptional regulator [Sphingomonadales bacterium]